MGNCICGPNQNESCGWPKGTVRALISVIIIILTFAIAATTVIILILNDQISFAIGVLSTIFTIISAVIAFYFGTKSSQANMDAMAEASEKLLEAKDREIIVMKDVHERSIRQMRSIRSPKRGRNVRNGRNEANESNTILEMEEVVVDV